jgi:hypothetical protein
MHKILEVLFLCTIFLVLLSIPTLACDCADESLGHPYRPIVFDLKIPPADGYEIIMSIRLGETKDEESGEMIPACVIYTEVREYPHWAVPIDDYGVQMIMLDDGKTFLPADLIIDLVNETTCSIIDPLTGILAGFSFTSLVFILQRLWLPTTFQESDS